jgi:hypothetical protein
MGRLASHRFAPVAFALFAALGCSSSKKTSATPPNLRPTAVSVVTAPENVQAGHGLEVEVELDATADVQAVGVVYRAFPQPEYDAHAATITSWVLGTSGHDVPEGGGAFAATLRIPADVPAGAYYVVPEVDPFDLIAESDESDQWGVVAPLVVLTDHVADPQLMIVRARLDAPAVEHAFAEAGRPGNIGISVTARAEATAPVAGAEIRAGLRAQVGARTLLPLEILDAVTGTRAPTRVISSLEPGTPATFHLDAALDPAQADALDTILTDVAAECITGITECSAELHLDPACVAACVGDARDNSVQAAAGYATIKPCLLQCLPFNVEAMIDLPGVTLYDPPDAPFGRSVSLPIQLVAPLPEPPVASAPLTIRPLSSPIFYGVNNGSAWVCNKPSLALVADVSVTCAGPVVWSLEVPPGANFPSWWGLGMLTSDGATALYVPHENCLSDSDEADVLIRASACGETATQLVRLPVGSNGFSPEHVSVLAGDQATVRFSADVVTCPVTAADITWSLASADDARLPTVTVGATETKDRGTILPVGTDPLRIDYRPPGSMTIGPPVTVTLTASVPSCPFTGTATIEVALPPGLRFEKAFATGLYGDWFGAGVDFYAGAWLDSSGVGASGRANANARLFTFDVNMLRVTDEAIADPRPTGAESFFEHRFEALGMTLDYLRCDGDLENRDPRCSASSDLWSDSKCYPSGPPKVCMNLSLDPLDQKYKKPCAKDSDCATGLKCLNKLCTKTCEEKQDCLAIPNVEEPTLLCSDALGSLATKKVIFVAGVPVTVDAKLCANYGFNVGLSLLPEPPGVPRKSFRVAAGPYLEAGAYASVALGITGILAIGVRGDITLLRDDLVAEVTAFVEAHPGGTPECLPAFGCIEGTLTEGFGNVLTLPKGELSLFVDYPFISWCNWGPCVGILSEKVPLGDSFELFPTRTWTCACPPPGDTCGEWTYPGLLCAMQSTYVVAGL